MMENKEQIIKLAEENVLHTYNRYPLVLDHGEGVYLYDTEGKQYLDFAAGIAVQALGYHYPGYDEALKAQIDKLIHTSNLYYNEPAAEAAEKLAAFSGMSRVFFTNSGTEAIEGALKAARKYAYGKGHRDKYEIIAMNHSFHGRSMGALSVTGNDHYQEPFRPLIGGVRFADYNDLESVRAQFNEHTCAVILETVQGEGGVYPATEGFLKGVKALCEEHDALLILDEIQCGMGRTGYPFAWKEYGVAPNIMTCAKALGCGVPVGAFAMTEKVGAHSLTSGDHGTTYGGNPLAGAAVCKVFELFEKEHILENVNRVGDYLGEKLEKLAQSYDFIEESRGIGLLRGLACSIPVGDIISRALEKGLILINAGSNIIRFVPPLVISEGDVDEMIRILTECLDETV